MTIKFLGINRINFTAQTGEVVQGYKVHLAIPAENGVGYVSCTFFMRDPQFYELFGKDLNSYADKAFQDCIVSSYGKRLMGISFKK